jgi:hypothetical protein
MKMILEEVEVELAITHYINTKYFTLEGKHLEIEFQVGRNPQVVTAHLNIVDDTVETPDAISDEERESGEKEKVKPFSDDQKTLPFSS